ncbi:MAG: SDR family oxidoreductase [Spirochaetia bacterium]|jgi:NAD(P)-dependent dehydrogenase (short-subunit alcohol dehydrogenase family)
MRLTGKKAIVTGAAGAIGSAIAVGLAEEGADVSLCYRHSQDKAERVVKEIHRIGRKAICVRTDVRELGEIQRLIEETVAAFGRLDIVINCHTAGPQIPVLEVSEETLDEFIDTNLRGYFLLAQQGARQMVKQGGPGWIVNVSSISSRSLTSTYVHYAATKGGIEAMTRGMAVALGRYGIRVNCVAPGAVMTPTVASMFAEPRNADPVNMRTPLGKIVTIEECVGPVLFFCSPESSGITGQVLDVDGGYSIQGMEWVLTDEILKFRENLEKKGYEKA